jgi:hypothetical protein
LDGAQVTMKEKEHEHEEYAPLFLYQITAGLTAFFLSLQLILIAIKLQ